MKEKPSIEKKPKQPLPDCGNKFTKPAIKTQHVALFFQTGYAEQTTLISCARVIGM